MTEKVVAPYGTWPSPLQAADLAQGLVTFGYPTAAGSDVIWQELRPSEKGRVALVALGSDGTARELLPPGMSARTLAHEYGGRAWAAGGPEGCVVVSSNSEDQRLWDVSPGRPPKPVTPEPPEARSVRFACPELSPDGQWVVAVRESHLPQGVVNDLVAIDLANPDDGVELVAEGRDFYSAPAFSPDGQQLAFVCWDHPNMPWSSTELWRGNFVGGKVADLRVVAGGDHDESVLQPQWSPSGELFWISDRSGWWNLYSEGGEIAPMEAEFAGPAWTFGESDYALLPGGQVVAAWAEKGCGYLGTITGGVTNALQLPYTSFKHVRPGPSGAGRPSVLAVASAPDKAPEVVRLSLDGAVRAVRAGGAMGAVSGVGAAAALNAVEVLRRGPIPPLAPGDVSIGEPFDFPTAEGEMAYAVYYPPANAAYTGPTGEAPPLIVLGHGGPTSNASRALDTSVQFWTTRGFAVVDVDYRGSTGYGRAFRQSLEGRWGVVDVEDFAAAATWLADHGKADPRRMVVRGRSASGLTVLAALARYPIFAAGSVRYPVTEIEVLAATTHKFESSYMGMLVPEREYGARSPLNSAGLIQAPVLFLHGLDDQVAPVSQSRLMVSAMGQAGGEAFLVEIEGEGHGFRRASTIVRAQELELAFFGRALGLDPSGDLARAYADLAQAARPEGAHWSAEPTAE